MVKTKIISAYPCMGKTTITNSNRGSCFEIDFFETRATKGMNELSINNFFKSASKIIEEIYKTNYYDFLFITEDDRLLEKFKNKNINITIIFPDLEDENTFIEYKERVISRSGLDWWNRVI